MLKQHRILFISILIIIGIAVLLAYIKRPRPVAVVVQEVMQGEVLSTITNTRAGTLKACQRARLSPSIGGQIENLPVKEGDRVEAGQLLLEIWNDDLQAQVALAKHEYQASIALARQACIIAEVEKREVRMPEGAIRELGEYDIALHLHTDVNAVVKIIVEAE